ncbi:hypothetical protein GSY47_05930 [Flavobacterium quisquiliarum]|nr:hypothetical protein [Flavobacterium quisquiliarum]NWL03592.1 hypothetical protein [Flavobacterium collinsii]
MIDTLNLIKQLRLKALKTVNTELIDLYWNIGEYIFSQRLESEDRVFLWWMNY